MMCSTPPGFQFEPRSNTSSLSAPPGLESALHDEVDFSLAHRRAAHDNALLSHVLMQREYAMLAQQQITWQLETQLALKKVWSAAWKPPLRENRCGSIAGRSMTMDSEASTELPSCDASSEESEDELVGQEKTTVMMRNIPNNYTRDMLAQLVNKHGFASTFDLIYLPVDFASKAAFGYAFLNFTSSAHALRFQKHFGGFRQWDVPSSKVCEVRWGSTHQGLDANIDRYRNCPVMHPSVADNFRPAIYSDGVRIPFPPPTQKLHAPKVATRRQ